MFPFLIVDTMHGRVRWEEAVRPASVLIAGGASDACGDWVSAWKGAFQGVIWQRCEVQFRRKVVGRAPERNHDALHPGLDRILDGHEPEEARQGVSAPV